MPETYTQEQIDEAMKFLRGITSDSETMNSSIMILLSALSTAEQERDALKAQVAELEARLEGAGWISVKERLPEGTVLCADELGNIFFAYCKNGHWSYNGATHWMPLPEPPAILGEKKE